MAYELRKFREEDGDGVVSVLNDVWGERAVHRFKFQQAWYAQRTERFQLAPCNDIVVDNEGEIVGYTRLIPCRYWLAGQLVDAGYIADNVTSPHHRGSGVKLFRHIIAPSELLQVGAPVCSFAALWEKMCKQPVKVRPIMRCVLMLRPSAMLRKRGVPQAIGGGVDLVWRMRFKVALWTAYRRSPGINSLTLSDAPTPPVAEELEDFYEAFEKNFYAILKRSHAYFRWRFSESPFDYRYLWLRDGASLQGYAVFRPAAIGDRTILLIVEIMATGDQARNYTALFERLCTIAQAEGAADIQMLYSGCEQAWSAMRRLGAMVKTEKEDMLAFIRSDKPYAQEMYRKSWFMSLAEGDNEFVMYP